MYLESEVKGLMLFYLRRQAKNGEYEVKGFLVLLMS